jgi:hypothetical protein
MGITTDDNESPVLLIPFELCFDHLSLTAYLNHESFDSANTRRRYDINKGRFFETQGDSAENNKNISDKGTFCIISKGF